VLHRHGVVHRDLKPSCAPEQLSGADVDARADLFSLGAVLVEMLGRGPTWRRFGPTPVGMA
jgi:serine/threonine protein kinase